MTRTHVLLQCPVFDDDVVKPGQIQTQELSHVGGDGLVVPSWLAVCWILGSSLSADIYSSEYHHGGGRDITGGFCPGAGFPSCYKSI
jgi:hypothetical protein